MAPSIAQCAVGAAIAWLVARDLLGHSRPFFAPIAVVICIGVGLGQRLRRVFELVVGVSLGIGVGDLLVARIGSGTWQIALVVAMAMAVAVLLGSSSMIALQAASSAVLVATLLPPGGAGGFARMVDALVGGLVGLAAVALLPASPSALATRHAKGMFAALADALRQIAEAVERRDVSLAVDALEEARTSQKHVEEFRQALDTSTEIATISPLHRHRRRGLQGYERAARPLDHALRNTRVLARRAISALDASGPLPPWLPGALRELAGATLTLRDELAAEAPPEKATAAILAVASRQRSERWGFSADVMIAQLRSIIVDLLQATGIEPQDALASLPPLDARASDRSAGPQPAQEGPARAPASPDEEDLHGANVTPMS
ncbi:aromatic acid exporter family protein [Nonomuraea phyllanthi]|uniref:Aromatic acid exporter family protein n=2 Tax=Nonomuraea phyllanthi TaxID=2219224 RepID=A0A5C4W787_9ACTN|nr:aromatic acid exporter family protein [Nonomuraea phyllanthi]QFY14722.1 aromatic acid exporter family protein [Nonomuraea phyllanthi]